MAGKPLLTLHLLHIFPGLLWAVGEHPYWGLTGGSRCVCHKDLPWDSRYSCCTERRSQGFCSMHQPHLMPWCRAEVRAHHSLLYLKMGWWTSGAGHAMGHIPRTTPSLFLCSVLGLGAFLLQSCPGKQKSRVCLSLQSYPFSRSDTTDITPSAVQSNSQITSQQSPPCPTASLSHPWVLQVLDSEQKLFAYLQMHFLENMHPLREAVKTSEGASLVWGQECFIFSLLYFLGGLHLCFILLDLGEKLQPLRCSLINCS